MFTLFRAENVANAMGNKCVKKHSKIRTVIKKLSDPDFAIWCAIDLAVKDFIA